MRYRQLQRRTGLWLMLWCLVFGMLNVLWIQSFTVTVVPSVSGLDTPDGLVVFLSVTCGILLLIIGGFAGHLSDSQPSVVVGRFSSAKRFVLFVLALLALIRVVLGFPEVVSGESSIMGVIAEIWFLVAGVSGIVLWIALVCRKRALAS